MNMALQRHVAVLLLLACLFTSSYSYQFMVGGKDGWVPNPSVSYNTWSQHMRFQINDSVLFKYKQGADSVLEVSKDDYDKCNTGNPIKKMEDGNSIFTLDRSGPFYFISGNKDNCDKGQKVQIVVISVRNQGKPPSTSPPAPKTPAPGAAPPTGSPPSPPGSSPAAAPPKGSSTPGTPSAPSANSPAAAPPTGSSSPGTSSPNGAPISVPAGNTPTVSPPAPATGGSMAPAMSPVANGPSTNAPGSSSPAASGPSGSMSPAGGPSAGALAPAAGGPSAGSLAPAAGGPSAGSLAPAAGGPAAGSLSPAAGGPAAGSPGGAAAGPGGNTPADVNSPAGSPGNPNSFAVKAFTPSIVLVSAVSLVLTVALGEIISLP